MTLTTERGLQAVKAVYEDKDPETCKRLTRFLLSMPESRLRRWYKRQPQEEEDDQAIAEVVQEAESTYRIVSVAVKAIYKANREQCIQQKPRPKPRIEPEKKLRLPEQHLPHMPPPKPWVGPAQQVQLPGELWDRLKSSLSRTMGWHGTVKEDDSFRQPLLTGQEQQSARPG